MPFLARDLQDMRAGWRKTADNLSMTIFVFRQQHDNAEPTYLAVSNFNQGIGELFETIYPMAPLKSTQHIDAMPARGEAPDYGVQYEPGAKL